MKTLKERMVDMQVTKEAAYGVFWLFLVMLTGVLTLKWLGVNVWEGAPWIALTFILLGHQIGRAAKRWLMLMGVRSEYSEPFDFDNSGLPECEDSLRWKEQKQQRESSGATDEMDYQAHA